jgi:hypothetical protein
MEEGRQGFSAGNLDQTNGCKHEEGRVSSGYSKEWTKANKNSHKMMLPSPNEPAPVITKTANHFEVSHNLTE